MKKMDNKQLNYDELQIAIQHQEKEDLAKCIQFFQSQFAKVEYVIPSDNRSDVNITATYLDNKIEYNVEIKQRNCYLNTFPDSIIEVDKYNYLVTDTTKIPIYYVQYKDCIAIYNLSKIDINKVEKRSQQMNYKTMKCDNKKVNKEVYGLTPNLATTFNKYNFKKIKNANYK